MGYDDDLRACGVGMLLAGILTRFVTIGMFSPSCG